MVSRVTGGDTRHYTTEDYLCRTGCEFIKFFMILKYCNRWHSLLIQENKLKSLAGKRTHGLPRDRRRYSPLYYRGLSMLNRLWVYKFFMILKYCNRWHPLLIQENKLNSPAGKRTLVSRVTGGDTHHNTTEDCLCWTGCEFINSLWFWSNVIDGVLY